MNSADLAQGLGVSQLAAFRKAKAQGGSWGKCS
jgi:hypothetical protein